MSDMFLIKSITIRRSKSEKLTGGMKGGAILFIVALIALVSSVSAFAPHRSSVRTVRRLQSSAIDDKVEVEEYFNNEGFGRWNKIYSDSDEVNKVQMDIRDGHQQTIDKVIGWMEGEANQKKTLCDAGCGVGSLALPLAPAYKKVFASDISSSMTNEASRRAKAMKLKNLDFKVSDMEKLKGKYNTVTCIDVMIHYPTPAMYDIVQHLGSLTDERLILSFAPKNVFYSLLKKVGELFPGPSKTTRAYLHPEEDVVKALKQAGFTIKRKEMTGTNFYFSRLLEAVKE